MKRFAKILSLSIMAVSFPISLMAQIVQPEVRGLEVSKADGKIFMKIVFDASHLKLKGNREISYTPMLVNGVDTLRMTPFTIAGRNRYYNHLRNDRDDDRKVMRAGSVKTPINYKYDTAWESWMDNAILEVSAVETGCCKETVSHSSRPFAQLDMAPRIFTPEYAYVMPKGEAVKMRKISARAYIDFPVNKTEIYPDYRRNPSELAKIRATIDSVRNDPNLTIKTIHIKGYASPEGSYANNRRLAEGRTYTLAGYVRGLYHFDASVITTSYEPEDWSGLREYVASDEGGRHILNREALLALITDPAYSGDDDRREAQMKQRFPNDYKFLLEEVYPGLRHSDYDVNYEVRSYTDPQEIISIMRVAPQNLSLQELFAAAKSQEPGSVLYNEAFEIAVRMYPEDQTANLNAACSALQRNDLRNAARYLERSGNGQEAEYARAILAAKEGNKEKAKEILSRLTLPEAKDALSGLESMEATEKNYRMLTPVARESAKPATIEIK